MRILFKNARILTMKTTNISFGDLLVEGNKIKKIAKKINDKADKVIDCKGNLLMPGFKNAHTHSGMTFLRSHADDMPLEEWLYDYVFPAESGFKDGDLYHLSKVAFLEYLTSGITAHFDCYFHVDEVKKASEEIGMRSFIMLMPASEGTIVSNNSFIRARERFINWNKENGIVKAILGCHAEYTTTKEGLKKLVKLADEFKVPLYTHCCETEREVKDCLKRNKMTPFEYLCSLGFFKYGGGIFHGVHLSDKEIKLLKKNDVYVCTCPCSNLKLASGIAPIKKLYKNGVKLAIGTDGPASNNGLDMFREMYLVSTLSKVKEKDPASLDAKEILEMATVGGARMLRFYDGDVLAPNKLADIIMIDLNKPDMQPINNIIKNIVYSGNKLDVKMTMINGKILYYDNKFYIKEDLQTIYKNAYKVTQRLLKNKNKKNKK